jgi:hypothetical protein
METLRRAVQVSTHRRNDGRVIVQLWPLSDKPLDTVVFTAVLAALRAAGLN